MTTLLGPGALPDGTGQRGRSALADSGARSPAPEPARGARLRLWGPRAQIFVFFAALMRVLNASAVTTGKNGVHSQPAAPQGWKQGRSDKLCPPGFFLSEFSGDCAPCTRRKEFTNHSNNLPSCQLCTKCGPGAEEISPCTPTKDSECRCRRGTFFKRNSPELCQPCRTWCPDGMVVAAKCTPWSDLDCVNQESRNDTNGEAAVPRESVTSPGPHNAPSPSSNSSQLWTELSVSGCALLLLLGLIACAYNHRRRICQGCGVVLECMNRVSWFLQDLVASALRNCFLPTTRPWVFFWRSCPPRRPGDVDNAHNEIVSNTGSLSMLASERELGHQEHVELEVVIVQSPEEAEHLLGPAGAEGAQMRRESMVSANDALKVDYQPSIRAGFTDNLDSPQSDWCRSEAVL